MTATEVFEKALEEIRQRDVVTPAESTLGAAVELLQSLDKEVPYNPEETPLAPWGDEIEAFLAAGLLTLLYGGEPGTKAVMSSLRLIARGQAEHESHPTLYPTFVVLLHHLVWATAACALANDRLEIFSRLAQIRVSTLYREEGSIFALADLRHPDAFDRGADRVYEDCRQWLLGLSFRERLAAWRRDIDAEASLAEAELLAALVFARTEPDRTYSHAARVSGAPERRIRERLQDPKGQHELSRLLEIEPDRLPNLVGELYDRVVGPDEFSRVTLFPET